jgi:exonuclease I
MILTLMGTNGFFFFAYEVTQTSTFQDQHRQVASLRVGQRMLVV